MAKPVGLALFGVGRAGTIHFQNIHRTHRAKLLYLVEADETRAIELVQKYQLNARILKPEEANVLYEDPNVQGVMVCSPTDAHENIVRNALKNGRAVFCEKPVSRDIESTRACYTESENTTMPLLCSFNRRFDPTVRKLRTKVKEGVVGPVHMVKTCSRDNPIPAIEFLKISGGMFHDCATHDLDMVCWILGEMPSTVYAQGHAHLKYIEEMGDVDTVAIMMTFPSGAMATIDLSRQGSYGYDQRVEVLGPEGMLTSENQPDGGLKLYTRDTHHSDGYKYSFPQRYAESYAASLDHFLDVIQEKKVVEVCKEDMLNITLLADLCEMSCKTGKPINLVCDQTTGLLSIK